MATEVFTVTGMTCGHCVSAVTQEVSRIPGVTEVSVELGAESAVTVHSESPLDIELVRAAVDEAGYDLMG